jgi:hypothetical protein
VSCKFKVFSFIFSAKFSQFVIVTFWTLTFHSITETIVLLELSIFVQKIVHLTEAAVSVV